jgi:hypothetical protein
LALRISIVFRSVFGSADVIVYLPAGSVVFSTTNACGTFTSIVRSLSTCALAATAPRPSERQSARNNLLAYLI